MVSGRDYLVSSQVPQAQLWTQAVGAFRQEVANIKPLFTTMKAGTATYHYDQTHDTFSKVDTLCSVSVQQGMAMQWKAVQVAKILATVFPGVQARAANDVIKQNYEAAKFYLVGKAIRTEDYTELEPNRLTKVLDRLKAGTLLPKQPPAPIDRWDAIGNNFVRIANNLQQQGDINAQMAQGATDLGDAVIEFADSMRAQINPQVANANNNARLISNLLDQISAAMRPYLGNNARIDAQILIHLREGLTAIRQEKEKFERELEGIEGHIRRLELASPLSLFSLPTNGLTAGTITFMAGVSVASSTLLGASLVGGAAALTVGGIVAGALALPLIKLKKDKEKLDLEIKEREDQLAVFNTILEQRGGEAV